MTDSAQTKSKAAKIRGGLLFGLGGFGTFLLMANEGQLWHGPLWGFLTMALTVVGLLDMLGLLSAASADAPSLGRTLIEPESDEPLWMSPLVGVPVALGLGLLGGALLGYDRLPYVIVLALLALVPAALRRPGLFAFVVACAIMLPMLGVYGLWDPWETHYGEVAREILSRDDWISLWWCQEDWFWSKPIFIFWAEALTMGALGVDYRPDANPAHPEWALRLPVFLVALIAVLAVYQAIARVYGKRAGMVTAIVLSTMPHFFMLSHQAITDMYFVGNMTTAMCLFIIAVSTDEKRQVQSFRLGPVSLSIQTMLGALVSSVSIAQILYLVSRNVTFIPSEGFALHRDVFEFGSKGNGDVPGNKAIQTMTPVYDSLATQPFAQGLYWALGLAVVLTLLRRERSVRGLAMMGFYVFCAFAFMGKGIPGFALPGLVVLLFLVATSRWKLLLDGHLRVGVGIITVAVVGAPWFVAMFMRHGAAFTDRLLIHDHLNRLAAGVHGDNGTIQYFLLQLGTAMFPWVALAPAALTLWLRITSADPAEQSLRGRVVRALGAAQSHNPESKANAWRDVGLGAGAILLGVAFAVVKLRADESTPMLIVAWASIAAGLVLAIRGLFALTPVAATGVAVAGGPSLTAADAEESTPDAPSDDEARARTDVAQLAGLWFAAAFTLFSAMVTKFHHYIFPAVPPAALLIGLLVDRLLGERPAGLAPAREKLATAAAVVSAVCALLGLAGLVGDPRGTLPFETESSDRREFVMQHGWPIAACILLLLVAIALGTFAVKTLAGRAEEPSTEGAKPTSKTSTWTLAGLGVALVSAPILAAFTGRDLAWITSTRPAGYERLIHLFVYNYGRPWPEVFDYRPILTAFAAMFVLLFGLAVFERLRSFATRALLGLAVAFAVWSLDVYLIDLSPHWSQRDVILKYYADRAGPEEPLLAYQMNWKGENFYSGNRVHVFADLDTTKLREWIGAHPNTTFYVALEHSRLEAFKGHVRDRTVTKLTDVVDNNKFLIIKVVPRSRG